MNDSSINTSNQSSSYQDLSKGSNNVNKVVNTSSQHLDLISDDSYNESRNSKPALTYNNTNTYEVENESLTSDRDLISEKKSTSKNKSMYNSESDGSEQSFENVTNKSEDKFIPPKNRSFMKEKNSARNVIDLTMNESMHEGSMNNKLKGPNKEQRVDESDIIVCSSTSTSGNSCYFLSSELDYLKLFVHLNKISNYISETEMDKEVVTLAKKEIGVGNIDPIEAQKRELINLNIDHTQKQLDKLHVMYLIHKIIGLFKKM